MAIAPRSASKANRCLPPVSAFIIILKSFLEEFVELLEKAGVEYDPRYLD